MFSIRARSAATAAAAALVLIPVAGCGDDAKTAAAPSAEASSASASPSSRTAGTSIPVDDFLSRLTSAMKDQKSVHMSIGGSSALTLEADVRYGASPAIRLDTTIAGSKVAMVIVDRTLYIQQPGGSFQKISKKDKTFGSLLGSFENFGPRGSIEDLKAGISEVVEVGPKSIDGVELTQYDVTADTSKLAGSIKQLAGAQGVARSVTMRFFLDGSGLVRQIDVDAAGQAIALKFTDWGKPVDIEAPSGSALR
ncbi:MAG: LppX_LprAFG lipoprotein [Propionibacteriales bacterium]|nr:LppX_LprAFG lipoprotein [Propionibacteriales bacterium]